MAEPIEEHVIQAASEAAAREIGIASLKNKQIEAITSFITILNLYDAYFRE